MTRTQRPAALSLCVLATLATLHAPDSLAGTPTIRNVVDSTAPFTILTRPSINDSGTVAFAGAVPQPGDPQQPFRSFIYTVQNGNLTGHDITEAAPGSVQRVSINHFGSPFFLAGSSFYRLNSDDTVTRLNPAERFSGVTNFSAPLDSKAWAPVFSAVPAGGTLVGVFNGPDPVANRLDNPALHGPVTLFGTGPSGQARFLGRGSGGPGTLAIWEGPDPDDDLKLNLSNFSQVTRYSENRLGQVLFTGTPVGGAFGLFSGPDPVADRVADTTTAIWPAAFFLNDNGRMVILGQEGEGGRAALYSGTDPTIDRLLGLGDPLFGSTLESFGFNLADQEAFNNRNELAFGYTLANGDSGIAVLTVPEPGLAGATLFVALPLLLRRRP